MNTLPESIKVKFDELFGAIHYTIDDLKIAGADACLMGDLSQVTEINDTCHRLQELEGHIKSGLKHIETKPKTFRTVVQVSQKTQKPQKTRILSNREIQIKISQIAKTLPEEELEQLCDKKESKGLFDIDYPLFVRCPKNMNSVSKLNAVKDQHGYNRWTWKHEFERNNFLYAITTQWYPRNDLKVNEWLNKHS